MVNVRGKALALFALNGKIVAMDAECPHQGGPLHEGIIAEDCVVCPWHGYEFELASGRCASVPGLRVKTYPAYVEQGAVWVELSG